VGPEIISPALPLRHPNPRVYNILMEEVFKGLTSTKEASERTGLNRSHIRRLLELEKVKGVKAGRDWFVDVESLDQYVAHSGWHKARRRKKRLNK
jgi:excisionase family DNA binding protein